MNAFLFSVAPFILMYFVYYAIINKINYEEI